MFLTNSSLNSRENINNIFTNLNQSNIYRYSVNAFPGVISDKGFKEIENHFFLKTNLTTKQKKINFW